MSDIVKKNGGAMSQFDPMRAMREMLRWDPFREMAPFAGFPALEAATFNPTFEVTENKDSFLFKADVPGVKKEDISVDIDGNVVRISAECRSEKQTKGDGEKVLRSERYYGTIARSFSLGQDVDESRAQAKYADGVLTLQLPKKATAVTRKIEIQ